MADSANKRILLTVLNWGLGHATRCVPMIDGWIAENHSVTLASDGAALAYLRERYPKQPFLKLPGLDIRYSKRLPAWWMVFQQRGPFAKHVLSDHEAIADFLKGNPQDVIVSDNRYGCWNAHVSSVLVTHQLRPRTPLALGWIKPVVRKRLKSWLNKFQEIWIPDTHDSAISGRLSKPFAGLPPIRIIGPLSRLRPSDYKEPQYKVVALLSGPEPQRSLLEEALHEQMNELGGRAAIVGGVLEKKETRMNHLLDYILFSDAEELSQILQNAELVVARSGYSTLMDLVRLEAQALLVPTPGQTEQEYLAKWAAKQFGFLTQPQNQLDVKRALKEVTRQTLSLPEEIRDAYNQSAQFMKFPR